MKERECPDRFGKSPLSSNPIIQFRIHGVNADPDL